MAEGNENYKGLAVPLWGESEITQVTAATDMLTLTRITGGTGDYLVLQDDGGTETFVINSAGAITTEHTTEKYFAGGAVIPAAQYLRWSAGVSSAPTTGLTKGDMFVALGGAQTAAQIGICISTAANTIRYAQAVYTTFGRNSA